MCLIVSCSRWVLLLADILTDADVRLLDATCKVDTRRMVLAMSVPNPTNWALKKWVNQLRVWICLHHETITWNPIHIHRKKTHLCFSHCSACAMLLLSVFWVSHSFCAVVYLACVMVWQPFLSPLPSPSTDSFCSSASFFCLPGSFFHHFFPGLLSSCFVGLTAAGSLLLSFGSVLISFFSPFELFRVLPVV